MKNIICIPLNKIMIAITAFSPFVAAANESVEAIENIEIIGRAAQYYVAEESKMATKTPTHIMDIPQSVQVLTEELIKDQAARQTTDLYRSISGITQFSYSGVIARGFRQDQVRYDGVQGDPYGGFSIPQLFNIERVEVLKGPSGMLYGSGEPGGLLNYVTKKPKFVSEHSVSVFAGNYDLKGVSAESTGGFSTSSDLAYRVGGFYQDKRPFRNNTDEKNVLLSAGLTWLVSDSTELTIEYDYIDQDLAGHRLRGVPVDDEGNFITDISYNPNEKTDYQRVKADVWQLTLNHEFTTDFTNTTVVRYLDNERLQNYHENRGIQEDGRSMLREFRDQVRENEEYSITSDFVYLGEWMDFNHTLLLGMDYFNVKEHYEYNIGRGAASNIPDIDIFEPVYGSDPADYTLISRPDADTAFSRTGLYVQEQVELNDHWIAIAGLRYDHFKDENVNTGEDYSDSDVSPRIGAIYKPNKDLSVYVSRSQGFKPQSLSEQLNESSDLDSADALDPEQSVQYELGIKQKWLQGKLFTTASLYQIIKDNVTIGNPEDTGENDGQPALLQIGEVTSEGFELDVMGDIAENWTATLNYAYNRAKITGGSPDAISNSVNGEFVNAPDHTLGLWTRYDFPAIDSAFSIGMDYVSERISLSGQKVKAYTVWDASWRTRFEQLEIQLNIKNLLDEEYATSGFNKRNGHFPGEPRSVLLQVSHSF